MGEGAQYIMPAAWFATLRVYELILVYFNFFFFYLSASILCYFKLLGKTYVV